MFYFFIFIFLHLQYLSINLIYDKTYNALYQQHAHTLIDYNCCFNELMALSEKHIAYNMTQKICIFFLFIIKNTCFLIINTLFLQTD